ncbi:hypothetical protein EV122DRAFT_201925 [Schizophyllum commune]
MELVKAESPKPKDFRSFLKDPPFLPALFRRNSTKDAESKDSAELSRLIVEGHDILGQAADLIAQNRWRGDKIVDLDNRWAVLYSTAPVLRKITKGRIHPVQFNNEARTLLADVQAYLSQFPSEPERLQPDEYIQPPRRSNSKSKHHRNDSLPVIPMTPITEEAPGRVSRSQSVRPSATDRERKISSRPKEMSRHASDSRALRSTVPETRDKERSHRRDKPELERSHTERRHESRTRTDGHHSSRDKESSRHGDRHREGHHRSRKDTENEHHSSHRKRHESREPTEHKPKAYDDKPRRGLPPAVLPQLPPASMPPPQAVTYVPYPGMSREEPRKHKSSRSHDHAHREREHSTSSPHRSSSKRHHSSRHASKPRPGEREYGSRFREDLSDYIPR